MINESINLKNLLRQKKKKTIKIMKTKFERRQKIEGGYN
jgi:hypothetical protein